MDVQRIAMRVDDLTGRWGPAVLRWTLGLLWLSNVNWKTPLSFGQVGEDGCFGLCDFVRAGVDHPVVPGSSAIFERVVLPNLALFGWVTLVIELTVAVLLISGRFVRIGAVLSLVQSAAIGAAVANAPNEWFWAYLLMAGLSLAVLVVAPSTRPTSARSMGVVAAATGAVITVAHLEAGFAGGGEPAWTLFAGADGTIRDIPDEFGRNVFTGSIGLGLVLAVLGVVAMVVGRREQLGSWIGWALIAMATVMLVSYRDDGTIIDLGSSAATAGIVAALGLSLTTVGTAPRVPPAGPSLG